MKNNLNYFKPPLTNFRCDELQPSETKTQAKLSGTSPENPAGFLRAQSYVIVKIGCFDLPQTQKERHAVRMEAAVCGEQCCMTTLRTAA